MSGISALILLVISYFVGCAILNSMGIIMIGSFSSLIIRPILIGLVVVLVGYGILKVIFHMFGWILIVAIPVITLSLVFR